MSTEKSAFRANFGARVKFLRKSAGLTQGQLADNLGISRDTISRYERGDLVPSAEVLADMAIQFGVQENPGFLLFGSSAEGRSATIDMDAAKDTARIMSANFPDSFKTKDSEVLLTQFVHFYNATAFIEDSDLRCKSLLKNMRTWKAATLITVRDSFRAREDEEESGARFKKIADDLDAEITELLGFEGITLDDVQAEPSYDQIRLLGGN